MTEREQWVLIGSNDRNSHISSPTTHWFNPKLKHSGANSTDMIWQPGCNIDWKTVADVRYRTTDKSMDGFVERSPVMCSLECSTSQKHVVKLRGSSSRVPFHAWHFLWETFSTDFATKFLDSPPSYHRNQSIIPLRFGVKCHASVPQLMSDVLVNLECEWEVEVLPSAPFTPTGQEWHSSSNHISSTSVGMTTHLIYRLRVVEMSK